MKERMKLLRVSNKFLIDTNSSIPTISNKIEDIIKTVPFGTYIITIQYHHFLYYPFCDDHLIY